MINFIFVFIHPCASYVITLMLHNKGFIIKYQSSGARGTCSLPETSHRLAGRGPQNGKQGLKNEEDLKNEDDLQKLAFPQFILPPSLPIKSYLKFF